VSEGVPPELVALGMAIKRVRQHRGKSQQDLAEASGVRLTTLKEIENATIDRDRRRGTLEKIAAALGVTPEYLYDLANKRVTLEELEDPIMRILRDIRTEFSGKLDALEEHLQRTDADRTRQHADLVRQFDVLHRLINSAEINIDLGGYRHGEGAPEE
jgi:transcriptional regulator with XRE-family HTH domain